MQTQISAFEKADKGKYFVGEYFAEMACVNNGYTPSVVDGKLSLSTSQKDVKFDLSLLVGNFLFMLVGFVILRRTLTSKKKKSTKVKEVAYV